MQSQLISTLRINSPLTDSPTEWHTSLAESQKGINAVQWYSAEHQKGAITKDYVHK